MDQSIKSMLQGFDEKLKESANLEQSLVGEYKDLMHSIYGSKQSIFDSIKEGLEYRRKVLDDSGLQIRILKDIAMRISTDIKTAASNARMLISTLKSSGCQGCDEVANMIKDGNIVYAAAAALELPGNKEIIEQGFRQLNKSIRDAESSISMLTISEASIISSQTQLFNISNKEDGRISANLHLSKAMESVPKIELTNIIHSSMVKAASDEIDFELKELSEASIQTKAGSLFEVEDDDQGWTKGLAR